MNVKANVLVTDDHTLFRRGTMNLLETFEEVGEVYEAENGEVALQLLGSKAIDLVLLDITMRGKSGRKFYEYIRKIKNEIPVIFSSAYSYNDYKNEIPDDKDVLFIQKPYKPNDLIEKVYDALYL